MKVLERAKTPEGIDIQIEDWKEDYSSVITLNVATYPIAKKSSYWIRENKRFRLDINRGFNNDEEVKQAFEDLRTGKRSVLDFAEQYYNGEKDKYFIGLESKHIEH